MAALVLRVWKLLHTASHSGSSVSEFLCWFAFDRVLQFSLLWLFASSTFFFLGLSIAYDLFYLDPSLRVYFTCLLCVMSCKRKLQCTKLSLLTRKIYFEWKIGLAV